MLLGKNTDRKIPWAQLLIEATLVVFSVLLALGVKSYRDTQVQEELARKALQNFKIEITENKYQINEVFDYHKSLADTFRSKNPPTGVTLRDPTLQNNAWDAAQSTGAISYIDFSIIEIASKIEEVQSNYQDFLNISVEIILEGNFRSDYEPERVSNGLKYIVLGIVDYENRLLNLYDTALKRMGKEEILVEGEANTSSKPDSLK